MTNRRVNRDEGFQLLPNLHIKKVRGLRCMDGWVDAWVGGWVDACRAAWWRLGCKVGVGLMTMQQDAAKLQPRNTAMRLHQTHYPRHHQNHNHNLTPNYPPPTPRARV